MNSTIEGLKAHRSIRKFTDQRIDASTLEQLLLAGQAAATSSFVQTTTLVHVTDSKLRIQLAKLAGEQPYVATCAEFFVFCADLKRNLTICSQQHTQPETGFTEHFIIATIDASLFAQNVVVAAESSGLGICYIGGIRNHPSEVAELLNLPEQVTPLFGLCLGYPAQDPEIKPRLPLSLLVHKNAYQNSLDERTLEHYDAQVREYYNTRTGGKKQQRWTDQVARFFGKEARPHMLAFLKARGFLTK